MIKDCPSTSTLVRFGPWLIFEQTLFTCTLVLRQKAELKDEETGSSAKLDLGEKC